LYETLTKPEAFIYMQYEFSPAKPFAAKMPAINKPPIGLNDNELLAVIAFVQSIGGEVTVDPSEIALPVAAGAIRGDAEAGKTVFKKTGCMKCHSVGSEKGGTEGPDLYPLLRRSDGLSLQRTVETVMASRSHQGIDQRLTVRDFNDLMAYLARFKGESGSL
jgi:cytochrome c2